MNGYFAQAMIIDTNHGNQTNEFIYFLEYS